MATIIAARTLLPLLACLYCLAAAAAVPGAESSSTSTSSKSSASSCFDWQTSSEFPRPLPPPCVRSDARAYLVEAGLLAAYDVDDDDDGTAAPESVDTAGPSSAAPRSWRSIAAEAYPWKKIEATTNVAPSPPAAVVVADHPCSVYLAESSIPGAGLGVYSAHALNLKRSSGETIGSADEAALVLIDYDNHPDVSNRLLSRYVWGERKIAEGGGNFESETVQVIVPGAGTVMNSHTGLGVGKVVAGPGPTTGDSGRRRGERMDRSLDPGAGAASERFGVTVRASRTPTSGLELPAGSEVFTNYGDEWFASRGYDLPVERDYVEADEVMKRFIDEKLKEDGDPSEWEEAWTKVLETVAAEGDNNTKVISLLPTKVTDIPKVAKIGSARHSLPNFVRSDDWLRSHGHCMDHLYAGPSTVPQAGRGAFAARSFVRDDVVAVSPVIPLKRSDLELHDARRNGLGRDQLLVNYCFGRPDSSLLLFPFAGGVPYINHGREDGDDDDDEGGTTTRRRRRRGAKANARIRWSTSQYNKLLEWLPEDVNVDKILARETAGLLMDVVATRSIEVGEEVLIDYGREWEEAWDEHVRRWEPPPAAAAAAAEADASAFDLNRGLSVPPEDDDDDSIRTLQEQEGDPYPPDVRTVCWYGLPEDATDRVPPARWSLRYSSRLAEEDWRPCDVVSRERIRRRHRRRRGGEGEEGGDGEYFVTRYAADMGNYKMIRADNEIPVFPHVVTGVPRWAVKFAERPYTSNQHLKNAFRHPPGLPEGMYPDAWLDRG